MSVHGGQYWGEHGGQESAGRGSYYRYANGVMRAGMVVCSFQLSDVGEGDGGFGCVPCSHKSHFVMPAEIRQSPTRDIGTAQEGLRGLRGDGVHAPLVNPACPKGGMILFLEATLHTTLPWTNRKNARRSLMYRYSPPYLQYQGPENELYPTQQPQWVAELTASQQTVLGWPGNGRSELDNRGKLID